MPYVVPFEDYTRELRPLLGGKNASLGDMTSAGLPVPPGFAVTTDAFATLMADTAFTADLGRLLDGVDPSDTVALEAASRQIRTRVEAVSLDTAVGAAIVAAYDRLCDRCGLDRLAVAVRSSATAEDLPDASFAGEHDSFLWIRGGEDVLSHVVRCWSSLWTARAICYRAKSGYADAALAMSVGVQKMVRPKASGVAFTLDPINGDRSKVAIDANWGLGEAVVAGEVTPDNWLVDKVLGEITGRRVSDKCVEYRVNGDAVERVPLKGPRASTPCLTDAEVKAVAVMARRAERHYGCPQDVEWAIDPERPAPENVVLLQARPETVWSRRARPADTKAPAGGLAGVVSAMVPRGSA